MVEGVYRWLGLGARPVTTMKTLKIGIADYDEMKARTIAVARGEHQPAEGEPRVWFTSVKSFAEALSRHNTEVQAAPSAATTCSRSKG